MSIVLNEEQSKFVIGMMMEKRPPALCWNTESSKPKSSPVPKKNPNTCEWTNDVIFDIEDLLND